MIDDPEIIKLVKKLQKDKQKDVQDVLKDVIVNFIEEKKNLNEEKKSEDNLNSIPNGITE